MRWRVSTASVHDAILMVLLEALLLTSSIGADGWHTARAPLVRATADPRDARLSNCMGGQKPVEQQRKHFPLLELCSTSRAGQQPAKLSNLSAYLQMNAGSRAPQPPHCKGQRQGRRGLSAGPACMAACPPGDIACAMHPCGSTPPTHVHAVPLVVDARGRRAGGACDGDAGTHFLACSHAGGALNARSGRCRCACAFANQTMQFRPHPT